MKRFLKLLGLLSLIAIIALGANGGCGCPGPISVSGLGKITGYVSSAVLETTRIPGATITVTGGGKTYTTYTDGTGSYTIFVPAGTYTVSASKETFNTKTESNVSVTADGTTTLNFDLTTGSGGIIEDPGVEAILSIIFTRPSTFDIRDIVGRITSKSDIRNLIKSLPVTRDTDGDYKTALIFLAGFSSTPPSGTQGSRLYVGTSQNGPFILMTMDGGIFTSMPQSMVTNSVDGLQPDTTYYVYPSLYGTWGETTPEEPFEFTTPAKLGLIQPDNNYTLQLPIYDQVHFEWDNLGQDWYYDFEIRNMGGDQVFYQGSISDNYYDIDPNQVGGATPGEYLWRVIGSYSPQNMPLSYNRQDEMQVTVIYASYSYPRRIYVESEEPVQ